MLFLFHVISSYFVEISAHPWGSSFAPFISSYYFVGKSAHVSQYTDARNFDSFTTRVDIVKDTIKKRKYPNLTACLGETADASSHGTANVSDRYVSLQLRVQNRRKKWNFLFNFCTMRKLSDLYSRIFQNY